MVGHLIRRFTESQTILKPEKGFDGEEEPIKTFSIGATCEFVHELRDPAINQEAGRVYMLYSNAGEWTIAIAEVHFEEELTPPAGCKDGTKSGAKKNGAIANNIEESSNRNTRPARVRPGRERRRSDRGRMKAALSADSAHNQEIALVNGIEGIALTFIFWGGPQGFSPRP